MSREAHHKLAGSYIEVCCNRPLPELLDLCKKIAEAVRPTGLYKGSKARIKLTSTSGNILIFAVGWKKNMMAFRVIGQDQDGQATVRSQITAFKTRQQAFLGFIPAGPKKLEGYNWYENFMLDLEDAIKSADPKATVVIEEASA